MTPVHGGDTRFEHHGKISSGAIRTDNIEDKGEGSKYGNGIVMPPDPPTQPCETPVGSDEEDHSKRRDGSS